MDGKTDGPGRPFGPEGGGVKGFTQKALAALEVFVHLSKLHSQATGVDMGGLVLLRLLGSLSTR